MFFDLVKMFISSMRNINGGAALKLVLGRLRVEVYIFVAT